MRFERATLIAALAAMLASCAMTQPGAAPAAKPAPMPLAAASYGALKPADVRTLLVIVHDDLPADMPVDYAAFAQRALSAVPSGEAVVLLRAGFSNTNGATSDGTRARGIGDGYAANDVALLGQSVEALRARYNHARTILIGDGGGAVLAANLAARQPALVDGMLLVGCPCALPEWRRMMAKGNRAFGDPVDSLDPLQTAGGVSAATKVKILTGGDKARVPARISRLYAEALALRGIAVEYRQVDADGPALLDSPELIQMLARLAQTPASEQPKT